MQHCIQPKSLDLRALDNMSVMRAYFNRPVMRACQMKAPFWMLTAVPLCPSVCTLPASLESSKCNTEGHLHFLGKGEGGLLFYFFIFLKVAQWLYMVAEGKVCFKTHSTNPPECPWRNESLGCVSILAVCAGEQCCGFLHRIPGP